MRSLDEAHNDARQRAQQDQSVYEMKRVGPAITTKGNLPTQRHSKILKARRYCGWITPLKLPALMKHHGRPMPLMPSVCIQGGFGVNTLVECSDVILAELASLVCRLERVRPIETCSAQDIHSVISSTEKQLLVDRKTIVRSKSLLNNCTLVREGWTY